MRVMERPLPRDISVMPQYYAPGPCKEVIILPSDQQHPDQSAQPSPAQPSVTCIYVLRTYVVVINGEAIGCARQIRVS